MLKLAHVSYHYPNGFLAVDNLTLTVQKGESVALIGQNGAGKTTTAKLLNGLLKPTAGEVYINDQNTKDYTTAEMAKTVGYVFQNPDDQLFNSTVYEELAYTLRKNQLTDDVPAEVARWAELCGIQGELAMNPYDLPLSVRKFVAIAAVLTIDPEVVIMDEPTAGQDHHGLDELAGIVQALKAMGKTIITITHDMAFVEKACERIVVMANRQIRGEGSAESIFTNTELMQVAQLKAPIRYRLARHLH